MKNRILTNLVLLLLPLFSFAQKFFDQDPDTFTNTGTENTGNSFGESGYVDNGMIDPTYGVDANGPGAQAPIDQYWFLLLIIAVAFAYYFIAKQRKLAKY